eukprot:TRINITY_DN1126_c0_g1_i10.p3 TRINITY_DN1126_c0_g1~~TRINITY_DN1126_c0_g1_i10.p3  ORF type:complete len:116 (+),score=1.34 TRINITY_DN1126_c0_g1_i10:553-900(+)
MLRSIEKELTAILKLSKDFFLSWFCISFFVDTLSFASEKNVKSYTSISTKFSRAFCRSSERKSSGCFSTSFAAMRLIAPTQSAAKITFFSFLRKQGCVSYSVLVQHISELVNQLA